MKDHHYNATITWTGNKGKGTADLKSYERDHTIVVDGKPAIPGTSEVSVKANKVRYNPEELLLSAVSACHMLWYLFLCADNGIVVTAYVDKSSGTMENTADGGGRFTGITLQPVITIAGKMNVEKLADLHHRANKLCYIANSCNFPIHHKPIYHTQSGTTD